MDQDEQGNGTLVPTGKPEPKLAVSYNIVESIAEKQAPNGEPVEAKHATMRSVESKEGVDIPDGDFDLVDGSGRMMRLKHVPEDSKWLVTSSLPQGSFTCFSAYSANLGSESLPQPWNCERVRAHSHR